MSTNPNIKTLSFGDQRDKHLLSLDVDFDTFCQNTTVNFDDRFRWNEWRVRGNKKMFKHWLYDVVHQKIDNKPLITDTEAKQIAFKRFCDIQERRGQLNFNSMYVRDVEKINLLENFKGFDYAEIRVVQDCVDKKWRWSTSFWLGNGGNGSGCGYQHDIVETRDDAIQAGINRLQEEIKNKGKRNDTDAKFQRAVNCLEKSITALNQKIIQPTLFG